MRRRRRSRPTPHSRHSSSSPACAPATDVSRCCTLLPASTSTYCYAIVRLRFSGKDILLNGILAIYLFPGILLIIPLFAMLSRIGTTLGFEVQDNLPLLIFTYLAQTLPVALYMLANYFRAIPQEIDRRAGRRLHPLRVI